MGNKMCCSMLMEKANVKNLTQLSVVLSDFAT